MTIYCDKCGTRHDSSVCPSCSGLGKSRPMAAPDDVRARFGFTISDSEPRILAWDGDNGCQPATDEEVALWDAHADMAGEVRELVEALQKLAAYPLEEFALEGKPGRKLFGANDWEIHAKDVLDARAALAKLTQEKP